MSDQDACCAHRKVEYRPSTKDGRTIDKWLCIDCDSPFVPLARIEYFLGAISTELRKSSGKAFSGGKE